MNEDSDFSKIAEGLGSELFSGALREEAADALDDVRASMKVLSIAAGAVYNDALEAGLPPALAQHITLVVLNASIHGEY